MRPKERQPCVAAQRRAAAALPLSPSTACCALSWRRDSEHGDVARETLRVFSVRRWQQLMPRAHCCAQERAVGRERHDWTAPTEPCDGPVAVAVTRLDKHQDHEWIERSKKHILGMAPQYHCPLCGTQTLCARPRGLRSTSHSRTRRKHSRK